MRLIILAAGQGLRLRPLTDSIPKCLVEVGGKSLLSRQIEVAHSLGISDIVVVAGYRADALNGLPVTVIENKEFQNTNMVYSLGKAEAYFDSDFIVSYGDIIYAPDVLRSAINASDGITVSVDLDWRSYWELRMPDPLSDAETLKFTADGFLTEIGQKPDNYDDIQGQYIGMVSFKGAGISVLRDYIQNLGVKKNAALKISEKKEIDNLFLTDMINSLVKSGVAIGVSTIVGSWLEIDNKPDLYLAEKLYKDGRLDGKNKDLNSVH